jgi:hypothetical protein
MAARAFHNLIAFVLINGRLFGHQAFSRTLIRKIPTPDFPVKEIGKTRFLKRKWEDNSKNIFV